MIKIDGSKIKMMREANGLTQLYLATAVDVTTDTISRWENKRYPSIKKENALKLAEALDVSLDEILDGHDEVAPTESGCVEELVSESLEGMNEEIAAVTPTLPDPEARSGVARRWQLLWGLLLVAIVLSFLAWLLLLPKSIEMAAVRIAPSHVVPGLPFPIVIRVNVGKLPASFILKEMIPENCRLKDGVPSGAVFDPKTGELKWLNKAKDTKAVMGYMLKSHADLKIGETLKFSGRVTQRKEKGEEHHTTGREVLFVSTFHWADTDESGSIDDEEILAVYDDYDEIEGISLDMDLIEDIWFGSGYRWDRTSGQFVVTP